MLFSAIHFLSFCCRKACGDSRTKRYCSYGKLGRIILLFCIWPSEASNCLEESRRTDSYWEVISLCGSFTTIFGYIKSDITTMKNTSQKLPTIALSDFASLRTGCMRIMHESLYSVYHPPLVCILTGHAVGLLTQHKLGFQFSFRLILQENYSLFRHFYLHSRLN
jgi:hypothetical protein